MKEKKLISAIDLDSKEFSGKVLVSLQNANGVNTTLINLSDRKEEMQNLLFLLMNTKVSERKLCPACNGYHYYFVRDFENKEEKDKVGLCSHCGNMMVALTLHEIPGDKIIEFIKSKGEINPYELLKDGIDKFIKEGKIKVRTETLIKKQEKGG